MSPGPDDREVLTALRDQVAASDPGLARFMTMFARLTAGEEMPAREEIRGQSRRMQNRAHRQGSRESRRPQAAPAAPRARRPGLAPLLMLGWLLVSIVFIALAVFLGSATGGSCTARGPAPCGRR
jgi:hypothetical protein